MTTMTTPAPMITETRSIEDPALRAGLEALLEDAVASGASVGYHPPLDPVLNRRFWDGVSRQLADGAHRLLVARAPDGRVLGSVQLALCPKPNGPHRAEVQKLLVHTAHRGTGLGRRLMEALESMALGLGRTLLVLDTRVDDFGEPFYERTGWRRAGTIPGFTLEVDGTLHDAAVFYKRL